jgi:RNA polymerase-interacting CarD/CdnL/TRCF family regulator
VILTVGSTVVYSCQGPCLVDAAVERLVAGEPRSFYHLVALYDSGGELFVPVDKVRAIGTRPLSQRSDIPKLHGHLMETNKVAKDWKPRANDILKTVHLRIGV